QFDVVNARDINAFALPGGPMYVNRGMIEAARNEGEMAGVMAHEIAHVALRHATAQATRQNSVGSTLGQLGLILGGAILGGQTGAQAGAVAAQAWQTKYSREYETQADILGARIMADAGYDPRDLANIFRTIAQQASGRGPEFLSSHPDPGNRYQNINREAQALGVSNQPIKITREFSRVQERLQGMGRAPSYAEIQRGGYGNNGGSTNPTAGGRYSSRVPFPSYQTRVYSSNNIRLNVPSNWQEFSNGNSITFAPQGAYGDQGITRGAMIGVLQTNSNNLYNSSQEYVQSLLQGNSYLRPQSNFQQTNLAGRNAYVISLVGRSPITNQTEIVTIYTTVYGNGGMLYLAAVAPQVEASQYNGAFRNMIGSLRISGY
ncbi:MAG: M48 family metalloprotease, partial [Acidobacteria bacterium]|nr:M48 family metalloprotease [Acidobacteriota bacterium]